MQSPILSTLKKERTTKDTKDAAAYEMMVLNPNARPLILLGNNSDTISQTKGPKLSEYPPATPNTDKVAIILPNNDI